ncbi:putative inactive carboxylesterase 4 isoform X4 [Centruroides sculpturatus]|uniref:putative inactive carboxylesterase 4 isoform X4 n=1 Tax=Centruroides sculpturatus TaxID=218467 RepID=UPI000C6EC8C1|nr:putative inactive carboxylesterase 4 isoform X4 [Centruroides sculpturatus]
MNMKILISFLICLHTISVINGEKIVHTLTGSVRGKITKVFCNDVIEYLGIPYAQPPVDKLRFRAPQPIEKWHGILNATIVAPVCTQDPRNSRSSTVPRNLRYMSEDCLYLNIWVPVERRTSKPFTTMVWIHGGAYNRGSSTISYYNGRYLASIGNVIVVSFNYRLGSFGFMYLNDTRMPGNMGMLDQVTALRWIYNNIEYFEGDRNNITLFGQSAGSVSITDHMISPLSRELFGRSILQSGTNYNNIFVKTPEENEEKTKEIATIAGCDTRNTYPDDVINCLLSLKAQDLAAAERKFAKSKNTSLTFTEQVDGHFLLDNGINSINKGAVHNREMMMGYTATEAGYKEWEGAPRFEDVFFVFGMPFMYPEFFTEEEKYFSYQIIQLWTSFAKTGNATTLRIYFKPYYEKMSEDWLPFDSIHRIIMNLEPEKTHIYEQTIKNECEVWLKF